MQSVVQKCGPKRAERTLRFINAKVTKLMMRDQTFFQIIEQSFMIVPRCAQSA